MSKFNLFADEPTLAHDTVRQPRPQAFRTVTVRRGMTPMFALGVVLWFMAMFAVGELILLR